MIELGARFDAPTHVPRRARRLRIRLNSLAQGLRVSGVPSTQDEVDRIHSYRLLAHAEIQTYLEDIAEHILDVSLDVLVTRGGVTHAAHHLLVFDAVLKLGDKRVASAATYPLFSRASASNVRVTDLERATKSHRSKLLLNSGLKSSNIRRVLSPLGYRDSWFPGGFLDQMDAFGSSRGDVAHGSGLIGVARWPTGSSELAVVKALAPGLDALDRYAARLLMPN
jgi:hypothetical protein